MTQFVWASALLVLLFGEMARGQQGTAFCDCRTDYQDAVLTKIAAERATVPRAKPNGITLLEESDITTYVLDISSGNTAYTVRYTPLIQPARCICGLEPRARIKISIAKRQMRVKTPSGTEFEGRIVRLKQAQTNP